MNLVEFYFKNYKKFLYIPFILLLIAIVMIVFKLQTTGDFINRDITLKGGITLTIIDDSNFEPAALEKEIAGMFSPYEISVRGLKSSGQQIGYLIESDIPNLDQDFLNNTLGTIENTLNTKLSATEYSLETTGSALGTSFFIQTMRALIFAFIFMGLVVFIYFRNFVPSAAVILSAFSDIIVTVAVLNFMGIKLGTAGIAALLMLIGYSIDTDIMLTARVLKRRDPTIEDAFKRAFQTGLTMTLTTIAAVTLALIFSESEIIRQIMTILLIGLVVDIINTWVQNSGLLIWYVQHEKKTKKTVH